MRLTMQIRKLTRLANYKGVFFAISAKTKFFLASLALLLATEH